MIIAESGEVVEDRQEYDTWIVATQNCDLDWLDELAPENDVELRPVFCEDPPTERGIRSRKHLLETPHYVDAQSRRVMISPAALRTLLQSDATRDNAVADDEERIRAFKTWLGYRYDRPAVSDEYVPLAVSIAEAVKKQRAKSYSGQVRDILAQFVEDDPPRYQLFAVIEAGVDPDQIREWLAEAARSVPIELGIADDIDAATADETSLALIEGSYAVDLTSITWSGKTIRGATGRFSRP